MHDADEIAHQIEARDVRRWRCFQEPGQRLARELRFCLSKASGAGLEPRVNRVRHLQRDRPHTVIIPQWLERNTPRRVCTSRTMSRPGSLIVAAVLVRSSTRES